MKKLLAAMLCLLLVAGLCACKVAPLSNLDSPEATVPSLRDNVNPPINDRGENGATDSNGEPIGSDATDSNGEPIGNDATDSNGEPIGSNATDSNGEYSSNGENSSEAASLPQTAYVLSVSESLAEAGNRRKPTGIVEYCELKPQEELSLSFSLGIPLEFSIIKTTQDSVEIALLGDAELEVSGKVGESNDPKQFVLRLGESVEVKLKDLDTTGIYTFTIEENILGG